MANQEILISLVVPLHNEADNLEWLHKQVTEFFNHKEYTHEVIYVDDGSTDESLSIIRKLAEGDKTVSFISLSRNFGKEAATSAGLAACNGQAVIMMDADGQHPVDTISKFIKKWQTGFDVVVGVRTANQKEGLIKRYGSKLHNWVMNSVMDSNVPAGSTDFRLVDRKVISEFNKLTERNRVTRGLIDWLGFKRAYVEFVAPARHSGKATYSFSKLVRLAVHSYTSQTTKPLQLTGLLGFIVTVISLLAGIVLLFEKYVLGDPLDLAVTGTALLAIFLSFLVGMVLICQWLLAIYVESIHNETQNRPLYIVAEKSK